MRTLEDIARMYPQLYSQKNMREWVGLFDRRAVAIRVENGASTHFLNIHDALPEQEEYARENESLFETFEGVEIHQYGNIAIIKANYTLVADHETRAGVDVLTLINDGGWRIVSLAYEQNHFMQR